MLDGLNIPAELLRQRIEWAEIVRIEPAPVIGWEDWKEALLALTHHQNHEFLVRGSLLTIARSAHHQPAYLVLEALLMVGIAAHNQAWTFPPANDEEADMP